MSEEQPDNAPNLSDLITLKQAAELSGLSYSHLRLLARKEKIPGFGHRVYRTEDPRATHLRQMSRDLGQRANQPFWFDMSQRIEAVVKSEKKLNANVDFYSASTYYSLGIDVDLFTPIFAA